VTVFEASVRLPDRLRPEPGCPAQWTTVRRLLRDSPFRSFYKAMFEDMGREA